LIGSQQRADGYPPLFGGEWELRQNGICGVKIAKGVSGKETPFLFWWSRDRMRAVFVQAAGEKQAEQMTKSR
jgi:hypothetical protein